MSTAREALEGLHTIGFKFEETVGSSGTDASAPCLAVGPTQPCEILGELPGRDRRAADDLVGPGPVFSSSEARP